MSARPPFPTTAADFMSKFLTLDQRIAELETLLEHYRDERDADTLADAQDAGDVDGDGNVIPYPKHRSV